MKVAMAQINPTIGDFNGNLSRMIEAIHKAKTLKADLIVFPEMTTTGYPPKDFLDHQDFIQRNLDLCESLIKATTGVAVVCGYIDRNDKETGKPLINAGIFFEDGKVRARFSKMLLPTYDVFDETRYFEPAEEPTMIGFKDERIGLTICEDIWNDRDFFPRRIYQRDPIDELANKEADLIINISASPYYHGKGQFKLQMLRNVAKKYRVPVIYVNQVGGNDDLLFDGCSLALGPDGHLCAQAAEFEEDLVVFDTDRLEGDKRDLPADDQASILRGLTMGTRDYMMKTGFQRAIVGLSGGIDSSLVLYIAGKAIGRENVTGVAMPSPYSSKESVEDARELSKRLGVEFRIIPITGIFESYLREFKSNFQDLAQDVTEENIQARIRGNLLMALSNKFGALVLSTGNKSEIAVGYCTLYGDMSGGLAVISDVPKTMVYDLVRYINTTEKAIPERVLTKPPSAELRPNQIDQDSLPPYEILDTILDHYIENKKGPDSIVKLGFNPEVVKQVIGMVDRNEYKRKQAPIGLKITSKAFGHGRRYPIAHGYN
jgi:NAD+ synthetase